MYTPRQQVKRSRSQSTTASTPSPSTKRAVKLIRHNPNDGLNMDSEQLKSAIQAAVDDSLKPRTATAAKNKGGGKSTKNLNKSNGDQIQAGNQSTTSSDHSLADEISAQVLRGIGPLIADSITAAFNVVINNMEKKVISSVTEKVQDVLQQQNLLHKFELDRLEQYTRRETLRISGLAEDADETDESLRGTLVQLAADCSVSITSDDISVCHRVGPKPGAGATRKRPVLCRFISRRHKRAILASKKKLKDKDAYKYVYVNENLTPLRAKLFKYVRQHARVRNAHTTDGKIICFLKSTGERDEVVTVETPDDLFKLGDTDINYEAFGLNAYITTLDEDAE